MSSPHDTAVLGPVKQQILESDVPFRQDVYLQANGVPLYISITKDAPAGLAWVIDDRMLLTHPQRSEYAYQAVLNMHLSRELVLMCMPRARGLVSQHWYQKRADDVREQRGAGAQVNT